MRNTESEISRNDTILSKEEEELVRDASRKEKAIADLQGELLSLFDAEKKQHKNLYDGLTKDVDTMLTFKQDYDAVKLSGAIVDKENIE